MRRVSYPPAWRMKSATRSPAFPARRESSSAGMLRRRTLAPVSKLSSANRNGSTNCSQIFSCSPARGRRVFSAPISRIESVTSWAAHAPTVASIHTRLDLPEKLPEVTCDPELLKQVLLNLLINATEATPPGGLVTLSARCEDSRIAVHVRDEGCGIPPEEEDKIFDPFFTTKENGTGLGLSIASKIVEQHGGSLTVERNSDTGMTFRLELPL